MNVKTLRLFEEVIVIKYESCGEEGSTVTLICTYRVHWSVTKEAIQLGNILMHEMKDKD